MSKGMLIHEGGDGTDEKNLVKCPSCQKYYRIHPEKLPKGIISFNCRKCGSLVPIPFSGENIQTEDGAAVIQVVVSEEDLAQLIVKILARNGMRGQIASTGEEAVRTLTENPPDAALISVVMADILGYEIIDRVSESLGEKPFPIILLSSIHRGTRYKRSPTSYYGADDHIERHHLPDFLVPKLRRLMEQGEEGEPLRSGPEVVAAQTDEDVDDRRRIEEIHHGTTEESDAADEREVRRMCRIIAGDIALYNEDVIRETPPDEIFERLSDDVAEGERLLKSRYPDFDGDYHLALQDEINRLLNSRRETGKA